MKGFKLSFLLVVLTTTLVACGNPDNDEDSTDSQIPSEDELASVLDVFSIEGEKVPFMEVQENSEGKLYPQTAGYFEDGQYIVDGMGGHDMDDFQTMSQEEVTAEIDSIVSEIDVPVGSRSVIAMDYTVEPYYEPLHIFKYTSPTNGSETLQIPIFFTMPNVMTYAPADMNEAQFDNFVRTERENYFMTDSPVSSMDVKLHGEGSEPAKNTTAYLMSFSINDPLKFIEDTTRSEREKAFPVFKSVDANKYESWVEIRPDANARGGTRSLLIYKTPEVIETLNLDSDSGLVKLTDEDDGDKVYVHVINE
ncbi:hypothetical protein ACFPFV_09430 [Salinicoccus siamensis]|uniref:Lipoprotein n=1 Tax=Salinicoccus siamensis TaxID=381830 RepID=A0ABV5Z443_9STAP